MALKEVREIRTDDSDGTEGAEPIVIGWGDLHGTVDMTPANRAKIEKLLLPYLDSPGFKKLTKVGNGSSGKKATEATTSGVTRADAPQARAWGVETGFTYVRNGETKTINASGGKLPAELYEAFDAANAAK